MTDSFCPERIAGRELAFGFALSVVDNLAYISFAGLEPVPRTPGVRAHVGTGGITGERRLVARHPVKKDPEPLHPFMAWMLERAGLRPAAYRPAAMLRRVPACLRQLRVKSAGSARKLMERKPELLSFVLSTALIGVSEFFRDRAVFDYLKQTVLPELLKTRTGLRVCGVGVSDGQEIYSLAILLAEAGVLAQSTLLGLDCRGDAIRNARAGHFEAGGMAGVEPDRRERFFRPAGRGWEVMPVIKERIRWRTQDLLNMSASECWDLMLFRNVAIYFTDRHSAEAWTLLCDRLMPGGFLITGKAEKPPAFLPLKRVAHSVYRKDRF